ncbi:MAG: hypothetical protein U0S49_10570 [Rhodospirillales bacterium]|nr:hypothetical protein [Rhodospirillales bacterium]
MEKFLAEAIEEERQLLARLEAVRAVIRAYAAYGSGPSAAHVGHATSQGSISRVTRSASAHTQRIKAVVRDLLAGADEPTPTRDLVAHLEGKSIEIAGKSKVASLSALLSHSGEFEPIGRQGWVIRKGETSDVVASDAAPNDEVTPSSLESQPDSVRIGCASDGPSAQRGV